MSVSTTARKSSRPFAAERARLGPSKPNGFVMTATVRMPRLLAICATTGAAPVPVPPPMPAVMKTMSQPSSDASISRWLSRAASAPTSGRAPAPRPFVSERPIWILVGAPLACSACASVFTATNSTPWMPLASMLLTALPPPPPTPITRIMAEVWASSSKLKRVAKSGLIAGSLRNVGARVKVPESRAWRSEGQPESTGSAVPPAR